MFTTYICKLFLSFDLVHNVWKSQKKSHSALRAKRANIYILSGQKFAKNAKMVNFGEFLKSWSLRSRSVTRQVTFNRTKIVENSQNSKNSKCDIFSILARKFIHNYGDFCKMAFPKRFWWFSFKHQRHLWKDGFTLQSPL